MNLSEGRANDPHREIVEKGIDSEQRLQAIFDHAAVGIVEMDIEDRFFVVNNRVCEILGYSREELLTKKVTDITAPEDLAKTLELHSKMHNGEIDIFSCEKRYITRNGILTWVYVTESAIREPDGRFLRSIGTIEDISVRKQAEIKLVESEERFSTMFRAMPIGISLISMSNGLIYDVNEAWLILTGFSTKEEVIGRNSRELGLIPDIGQFEPIIKEFQASGKVRNAEATFISRDKTLHVVSLNLDMLRIRGEQYVFYTMSDITEIRQSKDRIQELLRISEQRTAELHAVIESIPDAVYIGTEKGITECNSRALEMLGASSLKDLQFRIGELGTKFNIRWPESNTPLTESELQFSRALKGETVIEEVLGTNNQTGKDIYIRAADAPVIVNGKIIGAVAINSDITDRKKIENALRESEEKFRSLFENITEGVALHEMIYQKNDPVDYKIIDCNPAFKAQTGIDIREDGGILATELYNSKSAPYLKEYANVAESGKPFRFETYFPDMNKNFIINVISPKKGQFATVFEDITDQKRTELEIKQKNEELTRFIYTISHDLRSPLVTIQAFTSYLKEDIESGKKEAYNKDIGYIQNAADKMGQLLDELLELSRIGRKEKAKAEISLKTVVESALDLVAGRIDKNRIRVTNTGPRVMLTGHAQRFIQLYQNLIDNATKFMGDQPNPLIEIGSFVDKEKNNAIILFVRDNGKGIDTRYNHKIFGLFEKLDSDTEGTGIGLALVRRIIELHGGTIWFVSDGEGKGTTFYFTLEGTRIIK